MQIANRTLCALVAGALLFTPLVAKEKKGAAKEASSKAAAKTDKAPAQIIDLNTASQAQLESLPNVGKATAKKIIASRPYTSVSDLSKAGIPAATIQKITPLVTASAGRPTPAPRTEAPRTPAAAKSPLPSQGSSPNPAANTNTAATGIAKPTPTASSPTPAAYVPPPSPGMVWVNVDSKIYHRQGDRWYGKTKDGKYMTEADAQKAGYRASKEK